jgi:hypothetical protein
MEGFDVDGIKYRCRLDVNFAAADYRAGYKNPGAAPAPGLLTSPSPMGGRVPEPQVKERVVVEGQQQTGETRDEKLRPRR